jgi:hypothetical protein
MSADTTTWNSDSGNTMAPIAQVREGMTVVDQAGERIGKVDFVQMGDPQAVTNEGNALPDPNFIEEIGMVFAGGDEREPDVPEPLRSKLLRVGYIKVDGAGIFDKDYYVPANQIGGVSRDMVTLTAAKRQLIKEA